MYTSVMADYTGPSSAKDKDMKDKQEREVGQWKTPLAIKLLNVDIQIYAKYY